MSPTPAVDPVYDEVAAFLATLVAGGMRHVVLSPGSRSTPLTLCAAANPDLTEWMQLDERTAAFFALGIAKATRSPVALICTSGTAAANYFPAVIEASRTGVPLLVVSADRPPELHGGWGTNQTIDQIDLFGRYPRWFHTMPVGGTTTPAQAAAVALTAIEAMATRAGPVHINWPFRKPLEPVAEVPVATRDGIDPIEAPAGDPEAEVRLGELAKRRGVVVVGPQDDPRWTEALIALAEAVGWPILAESTSQVRLLEPAANVISASERFLLVPEIADTLAPEVVMFAGATPTGTSAFSWAAGHKAALALLIDPRAPWSDAGAVAAEVIIVSPDQLEQVASGVVDATPEGWLDLWRRTDTEAKQRIAVSVDDTLSGPTVAREVVRSLPGRAQLMVANSMAVRDLDRYVDQREGVRVHVSRGASGIDGQIATTSGIAAAIEEPVTLLVGDVAFLHDVGSVFAAARLGQDLTIVVVNDDGGGIFSMLPIAEHLANISESARFQELFHTPHSTDLVALGSLDGVVVERVDTIEALQAALERQQAPGSGVQVIDVEIDHQHNLAVRAKIDEALVGLTP